MVNKVHSFAYFACQPTVNLIQKFWPIKRSLPELILSKFQDNNSRFKTIQLKKIQLGNGGQAQGYIICCPLLPEKIKDISLSSILENIKEAGELSGKLGAKILGLGSCLAIAGDKTQLISKKLNFPITTGNSFTAWTVFESVYRTARVKNILLKDATLAVFGANNPLGILCCEKLAASVRRILLCDGRKNTLEKIKVKLEGLTSAEISIKDSPNQAVTEADIAVIAADIDPGELNLEGIKPNSIVCDASLNKSLTKKKKFLKNVSVVDAGLVKLPDQIDLKLCKEYPKNVVPASLAEVMLLAFEDRYTSYSLGENTNLDKLEEIANIAARHGFEVWVPQAPVM